MKFIKEHYVKIALVIIGIYVGAAVAYWIPNQVNETVNNSTIKVITANGASGQAGNNSADLLGPKGVKVSPGPDFNKMIENSDIQIR